MVKWRFYWAFYKSTLSTNLLPPFILAFTIPSVFWDAIPPDIKQDTTPSMLFWNLLSIGLMTFGPLISFTYKEWARSGEYYFYYNQGITKVKLILFGVIVNVLLGVLILIIKSYVYT